MSDINLEFSVSNNTVEFNVEPNELTITTTDINLTFNPDFKPLAGGNVGEIQYNLNGQLQGIPSLTYINGNLALGSVSNLSIGGGDNGYVLQTDGLGNLSWTAQTGGGGGGNGTPAGSNAQIQYNDGGEFGASPQLSFHTSNNTLTTNTIVATSNITTNSRLISTVATGTPPLAVTSTTEVTNLNAQYANVAQFVSGATQSNITGVGTLVGLTVTGNITAGNIMTTGVSGNISGANVITANLFIGDVQGNVSGNVQGNVTGNLNVTGNITYGGQLRSNVATGTAPFVVTSTTTVANLNVASATTANTANFATSATTANTAATVTTNAQPNITSVGTLSALNVTGNITSTGGFLKGNGYYITGITASGGSQILNGNTDVTALANGNVIFNVSGTANVMTVTSTGANVSGTFRSTGNANVGNIGATAGVFTTVAGQLTTGSQPNISNVGTLTQLTVSGTANLNGNTSIANVGFTRLRETVVDGGSVSGTVTANAALGTIYSYTLVGNITLGVTGVAAGSSMLIRLTQDSTGGRTLTSSWYFAGGQKTLSSVPGAIDIISVYFDGTSYWASLTTGYQ